MAHSCVYSGDQWVTVHREDAKQKCGEISIVLICAMGKIGYAEQPDSLPVLDLYHAHPAVLYKPGVTQV